MARKTLKYIDIFSFNNKLPLKKVSPKIITKPPTVKQKEQRLKFGMTMLFLKEAKPLINIGFKPYKTKTSMNLAASFFVKHCIIGEYPNYKINYEHVKISHGNPEIGFGRHFIIFPMTGGKIDLSWEESIYRERESFDSDYLNVLLYNETKNQLVVLEKVATRRDGSYTTQQDPSNAGDTIYSWIFFSAQNGKIRSATRYLGPVVLFA